MRTEWEVVSAISGAVSAIVGLISLAVSFHRKKQNKPERGAAVVSHYFLFCSGWVLSVLALNWVIKPFGLYPFPKDYETLYGIMLSAPALLLMGYAFKQLMNPKLGSRESPRPQSVQATPLPVNTATKPQYPFQLSKEPPGVIKSTGKE